MPKRALAVLGMALAAAEAGHLIAYQARFGAAALQLQSSGAHGYFPALAKTALGLLALAVLGSLFLIGLARVVSAGGRRTSGPRYISLLAAFFTLQLALFAGQETLEAVLSGGAAPSPAALLLWGMVGQLPAAALLAAALRWLWSRVEDAIGQLRAIAPAWRPMLVSAPVAFVPIGNEDGARCIASRSPQSRRGPPQPS